MPLKRFAGNELDQEMHTTVNCTELLNGAKPEPGAQPEREEQHNGEAEPSPHIRRHSRSGSSASVGYDVTLVADAHTTAETEALSAAKIIEHHNGLLDGSDAGGHTITVTTADELSFC
jgi:hypothetical protein